MTVPAAVPKERVDKILKWLDTSWMCGPNMSDGDKLNYRTLAPALKRLQHLEQLAERMTGAREALEFAACCVIYIGHKSTCDAYPVGASSPCSCKYESYLGAIRSLIASIGEGQ